MSFTKLRQHELVFTTWGGKRRGAGRKPKGDRALAPHSTRPKRSRHEPVHITMHLRSGLPSLRDSATRRVLETHLSRGADRFGFRLTHFSIQSNHIHLIAEVEDARALTRGMQGLSVRIARWLNKFWGRKGKVFSDRYFAKALTRPKAVRNALVYVLQNSRKHGSQHQGIDPFSSGVWFDGWERPPPEEKRRCPCLRPRTWLLRKGWRKYGAIRFEESPRQGLE